MLKERNRYSHAARILHWLSAVVILWATVSGIYAAVTAENEVAMLISALNVSLTTLLIPVFSVRIAYRVFGRRPAPLAISPRAALAARVGHALLYILTTVVLASGVMLMESDIHVFDWLTIPRPIESTAVNSLSAKVHRVSSGLLALMIAGHIAAVVRHERRGTLVLYRMTWRLLPRAVQPAGSGAARKKCRDEPAASARGIAGVTASADPRGAATSY